MQINIQYPNVSLEELDMMVKFYEVGMTTAEIATEYKTMSGNVLYMLRRYGGKIIYDKDELIIALQNKLEEIGSRELFYNYGIAYATLQKFLRKEKVSENVIIKTLNKFNVSYTIEFTEESKLKQKRKAKRKIIENATEYNKGKYERYLAGGKDIEEDDEYTDLIERGDISEVSTNTALIENYRRQMKKFLIDKGLSIETVNYVLDKSDSIARESTLFGIQCERLGKGQKLEQSIVSQFQTFRD